MALFGFLGRKAKPNLANPQPFRTYSDAPNNTSLSELAKQRIHAGISGAETPGVGFGQDFVSKTTNPVIAQRNAQFQQQEMPFISSQLSARGVGRSGGAGLATDIVNKASQQKNRDVDEIFANMYKLNKAQEKADISEGIGLGKSLDDSYIGQENQKSAASERLTNATAKQQIDREQYDDKGYLQGAALLAAPFTGGATLPSAFGGSQGGLYNGNLSDHANSPLDQLLQLFQGGGKLNALGASSPPP